jgi:phosphopantetheinyl transferase (holo-ACP synthase)
MKDSGFKKITARITREEFKTFWDTCNRDEWFSERELQLFGNSISYGSLAGRYLIKKSVGNTLNNYKFLDELEILNDNSGKPVIKIGDRFSELLSASGIRGIECSISHSRNYAATITIIIF